MCNSSIISDEHILILNKYQLNASFIFQEKAVIGPQLYCVQLPCSNFATTELHQIISSVGQALYIHYVTVKDANLRCHDDK